MNPTPSSILRSAASLIAIAGLVSACRGPLSLDKNTDLPVLQITHDDTVIIRSCWVEISPGTVIADTNGNGVIHIGADGITVRFRPGSVLRGADPFRLPRFKVEDWDGDRFEEQGGIAKAFDELRSTKVFGGYGPDGHGCLVLGFLVLGSGQI